MGKCPEKKMVGLEVGSKGTVNFYVDNSMTAKEGTRELLIFALRLAMTQGFVNGQEKTFTEVIKKLS